MIDYAIKVQSLSKSFILPHEKRQSIKSAFLNPFKKTEKEKQIAFHDLSFEVKKGEFFGIVGRNGSGKSTLLKCIAGVYTPNSGTIHVNGTLVPFIELGVGFNPELSGRDNVFLNGALLGFSRRQMSKMYDDIVSFAELENFMDQLLKNYSSGMQVRLAFSIAIRAKGDILLLDEVLAVGDSAFQQKCFDYFATLKKEKRTIILVSHSMASVERFCDRALLLENGEIKKIGKSAEVAGLYEKLFLDDSNRANEATTKNGQAETNILKVDSRVLQDDKKVKGVEAFKDFTLRFTITSKIEYNQLNLGINIRNAQGLVVFSTDTRRECGYIEVKKGKKAEVNAVIENRFTNGKYTVDINVVNEVSVSDKILLKGREIQEFYVFGVTEHVHSLFHPRATVTWK